MSRPTRRHVLRGAITAQVSRDAPSRTTPLLDRQGYVTIIRPEQRWITDVVGIKVGTYRFAKATG